MTSYRISPYTYALFFSIWCLMVLFLALTPMAYDDYSYSLSAPTMRDILPAASKLYMEWNGRFIANTLAYTIIHLPTSLYAGITATAFIALLLCMIMLMYGKKWKQKVTPYTVLLTFGLTWAAVPAFGAAFFWRVGTAYYLWTSLAIFASLVPFRFLLEEHQPAHLHIKACVALCVVCFAAGFSVENVGLLPFIFAGGIFWVKHRRKQKVTYTYYLAASCICLGFACLIFAPGNYLRLAIESQSLPQAVQASYLYKLLYWGDKILMVHGFMLLTLVPLCVLGYINFKYYKTLSDEQKTACICGGAFFLLGLLSCAAMFFSPGFPLRAFTTVALLYVQATLCLFYAAQQRISCQRIISVALSTLLCISIGYELYIFVINYNIHRQRLAIYAVSQGQDALVPPYIKADKFFFISSHIKDVQNSGPVNTIIAQYYKLRSVKTTFTFSPCGEKLPGLPDS